MESYKDIDGDSGISAYEAGDGFIRIMFKDSSVYLYTNNSAGEENIDCMKRLAISGDGLNSFINKNVKKRYESKEK